LELQQHRFTDSHDWRRLGSRREAASAESRLPSRSFSLFFGRSKRGHAWLCFVSFYDIAIPGYSGVLFKSRN
jgi:hypothetical protein